MNINNINTKKNIAKLSAVLVVSIFLPWVKGHSLYEYASHFKNGDIYYVFPVLAGVTFAACYFQSKAYRWLPLYVSAFAFLPLFEFKDGRFGGLSGSIGGLVILVCASAMLVLTLIDIFKHYKEDKGLFKFHIIGVPMFIILYFISAGIMMATKMDNEEYIALLMIPSAIIAILLTRVVAKKVYPPVRSSGDETNNDDLSCKVE